MDTVFFLSFYPYHKCLSLQIELFPPPDGEGLSYEISCKDLRPSLDWSPENGWTMPIPKVAPLDPYSIISICIFYFLQANPIAGSVLQIN